MKNFQLETKPKRSKGGLETISGLALDTLITAVMQVNFYCKTKININTQDRTILS